MSAEIGQPAPDFTLRSHTDAEITLSQYRGTRPVVLIFIPFAFTRVCEGELCTIQEDFTPFEAGGAEVLAITCDTRPSLKQWADNQGWTFEVLSDHWPHGEVARRYGAFNEELGCANRVTVVIDKDGTIVDRFEAESLGTPRPSDRYEEAMSKV